MFIKKLLWSVSFLMLITGCSSLAPSGDTASYYEASYYDRNKAPVTLIPPDFEVNGPLKLDSFYVQTQADYHFSMGESYSLEGNHSKAVESFKNALVYDQNSSTIYLRIATEYLKLGSLKDSLDFAEQSAKRDPKNVETKLLIGGLYSSMKLYSKAVEIYESILKIDPQNVEAPLYIGAVLSEQKQFDKAVKYFESLIKNSEYTTPHLAYYYIGRVRAEQKEEKYQKAAELSFKKSLEIKPEFVDGILALSAFYQRKKMDDTAIKILSNFQKNQGAHPKVADVLSQLYIEKEMYDEAYEQYEVLENSTDDVLSVKMKMALILIEKKFYDKASLKLEDILLQAPESDKVRFYLGAVYEEMRKYSKAIHHFSMIQPSSQFYSEANVHIAYLLRQTGEIDKAIVLVEGALKEKKDNSNLFVMMASLLDEKQDYKKASHYLEMALDKFPDNPQVHFYYGTISDKLGKKDLVVFHMKKAIEFDPHHVQGMNYLAFTWAEQNENLKEAELLARKAVQIDPKDGFTMDTLGWVLFKQGRYTESVAVLEAALKYQPKVSIIAEHLGDVYHKQALIEKAKNMYNKALDLETDQQKIEEIRDKITSVDSQRLNQGRLPASVGGR